MVLVRYFYDIFFLKIRQQLCQPDTGGNIQIPELMFGNIIIGKISYVTGQFLCTTEGGALTLEASLSVRICG